MRNAVKPIGSGNLLGIFEEKDVLLSQATLGRILTKLERYGCLEKKGNKGRVITKKGELAITKAKLIKENDKCKSELDNLLNTKVLKKFLMILDARKAIESVTARMASENIKDREVKKLEQLLKKKKSNYEKGGNDALVDVDFHTTIAEASGNEVLKLLYQILSKRGQQSNLFRYMRKKVGEDYLSSHEEILEALKEHDPDKAEKSMAQHIEILKSEVRKYWNKFYS
jgi:DNA-binding FadR family transcriptional regulator